MGDEEKLAQDLTESASVTEVQSAQAPPKAQAERVETAKALAKRLRKKLQAERAKKVTENPLEKKPSSSPKRGVDAMPEWMLPIHRQRKQPGDQGRWNVARPPSPEKRMSFENEESIEALEAIGYVSGSSLASIEEGVIFYDKARAFQGLNLYCSGHGQEALLMDVEGKVHHSWKIGFKEAFPKLGRTSWLTPDLFWRRVYLYPNGDLLAIYEGLGLIKIDKDSNLIWSQENGAHHDLEITPNGEIFVLTRKAHYLKRLNSKRPILEDFVSILDREGNLKRSISILEAFENSKKYRHLWEESPYKSGDCFHTNTLSVLDGSIAEKAPAFQKGRVLISILRMHLIAVMDLDKAEIVWARRGAFRSQHDPHILENGNMLLFDNRGALWQSRVLELDPLTLKTIWSFTGTKEKPFYSRTCGTAQRLPNGNTLITESDPGRAFEVTPKGEIVWDFYNPKRAGENQEFIATLFCVERLLPDFPLDWLPRLQKNTSTEQAGNKSKEAPQSIRPEDPAMVLQTAKVIPEDFKKTEQEASESARKAQKASTEKTKIQASAPSAQERNLLPVWDRSHREQDQQHGEKGRWNLVRPRSAKEYMSDENLESIEELEAIGYVSGSSLASFDKGVVYYNRSSAYEGLNLYCSGHGGEAFLIDMEGEVKHTWKIDIKEAFPDLETNPFRKEEQFWRRVYLYPNGDLLAIYAGVGMIKLDKDSNLIWSQENGAHHDLEIMANGDIYALTRKAHYIERVDPDRAILEDFVTITDSQGREKRSISILECLENSESYRYLWEKHQRKWGDCFHSNTIFVLDGAIADKVPAFQKGRVLISILAMRVLVVLDLDKIEVVWAFRGSFRGQHDSQILENGNLLLFDNKGIYGKSRVLEIDPVTKKTVWSFMGTEKNPFYSRTCSTVQRLPNGNTLITESDPGRAFEVTAEKEIVWDFYNPNRAGENQEYIATLFCVERLLPDFPLDWLEASEEKKNAVEEKSAP